MRGGRTVMNLALFTYFIPAAFLAVPMYKTMGHYGLLNNQWSLILAMVTIASPYCIWVLKQASDKLPLELDEAARIDALAVRDLRRVVAGHDVYPIGLRRRGAPVTDLPDPPTTAGTYATEAQAWHARYGVDAWIAETSNLGYPPEEQVAWLDAIAGVVEGLRTDGIPHHGLCWYSRGDQFDWHTALTRPVGEITPVGLFRQDRTPRPSAAALADLASRWGRADA